MSALDGLILRRMQNAARSKWQNPPPSGVIHGSGSGKKNAAAAPETAVEVSLIEPQSQEEQVVESVTTVVPADQEEAVVQEEAPLSVQEEHKKASRNRQKGDEEEPTKHTAVSSASSVSLSSSPSLLGRPQHAGPRLWGQRTAYKDIFSGDDDLLADNSDSESDDDDDDDIMNNANGLVPVTATASASSRPMVLPVFTAPIITATPRSPTKDLTATTRARSLSPCTTARRNKVMTYAA